MPHALIVGLFVLLCSGMGDHKNLVSTIMQALMPMAIVPIMWTIIG